MNNLEDLDDVLKRLESEHAASPVWKRALDRAAFRAARLPRDGRRLAVRTWQRARRGWAHEDTWSLDWFLARAVGGALVHMADHAISYPGRGDYTTHQAWVADLRKHGRALLEYPGTTEQLNGAEDHAVNARAAMHWVADNFTDLWD